MEWWNAAVQGLELACWSNAVLEYWITGAQSSPDKNDLILRSNRDEIFQDFRGLRLGDGILGKWSDGVMECCGLDFKVQSSGFRVGIESIV